MRLLWYLIMEDKRLALETIEINVSYVWIIVSHLAIGDVESELGQQSELCSVASKQVFS
jgi:hypothetical protein